MTAVMMDSLYSLLGKIYEYHQSINMYILIGMITLWWATLTFLQVLLLELIHAYLTFFIVAFKMLF